MTYHFEALQQILKRKRLDAIFISKPSNVSYISGFNGEDSFLLIIKNQKPIFITDFRYLYQAEKETKGFEILRIKQPLLDVMPALIKKHCLKKIGFEATHLSFEYASKLNRTTKNKFIPTEGLVEELRVIKNNSEIDAIKKAAIIAKNAIKNTIGRIKAGMSELEIAGYLEFYMRKQGAEKIAFTPIVASGVNSSMPHAVSSTKKIKENEPIIIDCGCCF